MSLSTAPTPIVPLALPASIFPLTLRSFSSATASTPGRLTYGSFYTGGTTFNGNYGKFVRS